MKAVISTTHSDTYLFFLPIVTWCWNKLDVDVICFMPEPKQTTQFENIKLDSTSPKIVLAQTICVQNNLNVLFPRFKCPEHKEATYAQCSRLYAAALDLPLDEVVVTSDIDMAVFKLPTYIDDNTITIFGGDLVPKSQWPMCYATATVRYWGEAFGVFETDYNPTKGYFISSERKGYQQLLDDLLGEIECESFRGNYWGKDQETLYQKTWEDACIIDRARPGTQFAEHRIDRDDAFFMDRLSPDIIDYHMHRPGYTDENFEKILSVIKYFYPNEDLNWMINYRNEYIKLS